MDQQTQTPIEGANKSDNFHQRPMGGQVMDIQSPKAANSSDTAPLLTQPQTPGSASDSVAPPNSPTGSAPELADSTKVALAEAPVDPSVSLEPTPQSSEVKQAAPLAAPTPSPTATEVTAESTTPDKPVPTANPLAIPPVAPKKAATPVLPIVIAITIALALAALVVFMFVKNKNSTVKESANTSQSAKPVVTPADVDGAQQQIDTGLSKMNDTTDFAGADLTDKTLGL